MVIWFLCRFRRNHGFLCGQYEHKNNSRSTWPNHNEGLWAIIRGPQFSHLPITHSSVAKLANLFATLYTQRFRGTRFLLSLISGRNERSRRRYQSQTHKTQAQDPDNQGPHEHRLNSSTIVHRHLIVYSSSIRIEQWSVLRNTDPMDFSRNGWQIRRTSRDSEGAVPDEELSETSMRNWIFGWTAKVEPSNLCIHKRNVYSTSEWGIGEYTDRLIPSTWRPNSWYFSRTHRRG